VRRSSRASRRPAAGGTFSRLRQRAPGSRLAIRGVDAELAERGVGRDDARDLVVEGVEVCAGRDAKVDLGPGSRAERRRTRPTPPHWCRLGSGRVALRAPALRRRGRATTRRAGSR
jgi:hypothetical protein